MFNAQGNLSIFMSKVPNCKDKKIKNVVPGPGTYDDKRDVNTAPAHKRSTSDSQSIQSTAATMTKNNFMSTTKREDFWKNEIDAPFTK